MDNRIDEDFGANEWLIDDMRQAWINDPSSVPPEWAQFFTSAAPTNETPAAASAGLSQPPQHTDQTPLVPPEETTPQPGPSAHADTPEATVEPPQLRTAETPPAVEVGLSADPDDPTIRPDRMVLRAETVPLKGAQLRTARNMDSSLKMPTATSVRTIPMKLVIDLRAQMNNHLNQTRGGRISFTHIIAYAMVQGLKAVPAMNVYYLAGDNPSVIAPQTVNLGLAIDHVKPDGTRQLMVPVIRQSDSLDFGQFVAAYQDLVHRTQDNRLAPDDLAGATCTITNPGGLGTTHSVPRLMPGQGVILGLGSIDFAPGFQGASPSRLSELGISKVTTLTSTYDHRVIQGAQSGEFLRYVEELLLGQHDFYTKIFESLRIPYSPLAWDVDVYATRQNQVAKTARVIELIHSYRTLGHMMADTDPLMYRQRSYPDLELAPHGLTLWDLDREFAVGTLGGKSGQYLTLRETLTTLQDAYCRTIGVEYMHIFDPEQRVWFQQRLESPRAPISYEEHMRILDRLIEAEIFENFLQRKYVGQTRFSIEGGESAIVILDQICDLAADDGLSEVCIGMPHRGRLNILANIVGKSYAQIFQEFEEGIEPASGVSSGDVKYHLGSQGEFHSVEGNTIDVSVAANPSHLEAVDPVLEGIARAKQDASPSQHPFPILPVLMHGDASLAGEGVAYETLQMSQLRAYTTGGTIHIVVNNQIGFTTAPVEARSSTYCTDLAKTVQAPVLHVNGDDADACVRAARLAFAYREAFHKDIFIDMLCYRRRGHNEGDDPSFTQPLMYDLIAQKRSVRALYTESLTGRGDISADDAAAVEARFRSRLESVFDETKQTVDAQESDAPAKDDEYALRPAYPTKHGIGDDTSITADVMESIAQIHERFPEGFTVHPKVLPQMTRRATAIRSGGIDWATAEMLAFGSLLLEGRAVRLVGQDSRRGTFSQRFGAVVDRVTNEAYVPLKHLSATQGSFDIFDSLLNEYAAMGFEYGYSVAAPETLVLWEAQYGDFANQAQTVIDEFVVSGNAKWEQKSGVVILLPHGYEGQGPDHSSARLERWLQLCSEGALALCQPSTPASYFHLLRTHAYVTWHRPLVVATPKSMLRNKMATSTREDFLEGSWKPVLGDESIKDPSKVTRILLCAGKIRWELAAERSRLGLDDQVAIITMERFYPIPSKELAEQFSLYPQVRDLRYVQEEPENQGAWLLLEKFVPAWVSQYLPSFDMTFTGICRPSSSAPDVGSHHLHADQQHGLICQAFSE